MKRPAGWIVLAVLGAALWCRQASAQDEYLDRLFAQFNEQLDSDRLAEAERTARRMVEESPTDSWRAASLNCLGRAYSFQGKYDAAVETFRAALEIPLESTEINRAWIPLHLSKCLSELGQHEDARDALSLALSRFRKLRGDEHADTAWAYDGLGWLEHNVGNYVEAEKLFRHCVRIRERLDPGKAHESLFALGDIYEHLGRLADAERCKIRAYEGAIQTHGRHNTCTVWMLMHLGKLYRASGRLRDAERALREVVATQPALVGRESIKTAFSMHQLGAVYTELGEFDEAERWLTRALAVQEQELGREHVYAANVREDLGWLAVERGDWDSALSRFDEALRVVEAEFGERHQQSGVLHAARGHVRFQQGDLDEAGRDLDRGIAILEATGANSQLRYRAYVHRAQARWAANRRTEALSDLRIAMDLAEESRTQASGLEQDRGSLFGSFAEAFQTMIRWQMELGNRSEAFAAAERMRARELFHQFEAHGIDLLAGLPADDAAALRDREQQARFRVARVERQVALLDEQADLADAERAARRQALERELRAAREEYLAASRDIRNASVVWRSMAGSAYSPRSLAELQAEMRERQAMWLQYIVGDEQVIALAITPDGTVELLPLTLEESEAAALDVAPGPLTRAGLRKALSVDGQPLADALARADTLPAVLERSAVWWHILVPERCRQELLDGTAKHLVVSPDGELCQLPFEMLVVHSGEEPRDLLDDGPPISYVPSGTVSQALASRPASSAAQIQALSVGDPTYDSGASGSRQDAPDPLQDFAAHRAGARGRASLQPLPYSQTESRWVAEVLGRQGYSVERLTGEQATEQAIRQRLSGRRIVHLACHGFVDQDTGNYLGALAVTPGDALDPADDGFLSLAEIYGLDLQGCELAILSACQTNDGPQQQGEGVWALSRGFLVAGSRRVVASNWLVDDRAAASLVSVFCSSLSGAESSDESVDYAAALQRAKRWCRSQEGWSSPYYWATFVLVGPP
jgi:CHAT domain-containing protein/tetratricopeptide (TPR) repeat protein